MATNIIRYAVDNRVRWGVLDGSEVHPLRGDYATTGNFVTHAATAVIAGTHEREVSRPLAGLRVLSPITRNHQYVSQAINYRSHMRESGLDPDASPFNVFFRKASSCIVAADDDIVCPGHVEFLDYEAEIGLVMAGSASSPLSIAPGDLSKHVAALVALNDVSARDVQLGDGQFYKAKSYRTFGPTGPHLTLVDEADLTRFAELRLRLWVNGDVRQDEYATDMIHQPAASLAELSEVQDWSAGDLVATGTPGGCALQAPATPVRLAAQLMSPRLRHKMVQRAAGRNGRRLRPGDVVEIHIGTGDGAIDLGRQRSVVVSGCSQGSTQMPPATVV